MSGKKTYKSGILHVFYGELKTAPMINDCSLCMECKLDKVFDNGPNEMFIGQILGVYTEEQFLTDGKLDFIEMKPPILSQPDTSYWKLGEKIADAWSIGKQYKSRNT